MNKNKILSKIEDHEKKLEKLLSIQEILKDIETLEFDLGYTKENIQRLGNKNIEDVDDNTMKVIMLAISTRQKHIEEVLLKLLYSCLSDDKVDEVCK